MTRTFSVEQLEQLHALCQTLTRKHPTMKRLVVISAGTGNPSSTRQLTDRIAAKSARARSGRTLRVSVIELGPLAVDTARAAVAGFPGAELQAAIDRLAAADGDHRRHPVYKAGHQRPVQDVRRRARQRPDRRQAGAARGHRRHAAPRTRHRRPAAPAVRLHARADAPDVGLRGAGGLGRDRTRHPHRACRDRAGGDGPRGRRAADRRPRLVELSAPVRRQRRARRAHRRRRRLRLVD